MTPPKPIQATNLTKSYAGQTVLKDLSFTLEPGSLTSLVGPNGTGKSTLLKILMRIEMPDQGEARVLGHSIHEDHPHFNRGIGFVTESLDYTLPFAMKRVAGLMSSLHRDWSDEIFLELAALFQLPLTKQYREVSRGQKMQFAFAVACASRPKLLLLDEITAVLDASVRLEAMKYLKRFTLAGGTVLLATNILTEVQSFADRLIILGGGAVGFDDLVSNFPLSFAKLRAVGGAGAGGAAGSHPVFADPACVEVGINTDRSVSYLIPRASLGRYPVSDGLLDQRGITPEDLFIYFNRKAG